MTVNKTEEGRQPKWTGEGKELKVDSQRDWRSRQPKRLEGRQPKKTGNGKELKCRQPKRLERTKRQKRGMFVEIFDIL